MRLRSDARILALALTLAACGGREPAQARRTEPAPAASSAPAATVDACQLLTEQEVEAALGQAVGDPAPEVMAPVFGCRWPIGRFDGLSLSVLAYDSPAQALGGFEMALKINNYEQVAGLGERAYTSPIHEITVLQGRFELGVDVNLDDADEVAIAKRVAGMALARLPR